MNAYNLWNTSQIHRFPDKYRTISPAPGGDANASKKKFEKLGVTHRVIGSTKVGPPERDKTDGPRGTE